MSEIQTPHDDNFIKKAVIAGTILVGTVGLGMTANAQEGHLNDIAQQAEDSKKVETAAYNNSIEAAINASYDASKVVGEIPIQQGSNLIDPAESIIKTALGEDLYNNIKSRIYSPLLDSAKHYSPQPGETYYVVETDLDSQLDNGNEYIIVDQTHVLDSEMTAIPTPVIEDGSH
jgi:hypothetical protein